MIDLRYFYMIGILDLCVARGKGNMNGVSVMILDSFLSYLVIFFSPKPHSSLPERSKLTSREATRRLFNLG